jgi:hypothetical protein
MPQQPNNEYDARSRDESFCEEGSTTLCHKNKRR